jgi:hypothetical protein
VRADFDPVTEKRTTEDYMPRSDPRSLTGLTRSAARRIVGDLEVQ